MRQSWSSDAPPERCGSFPRRLRSSERERRMQYFEDIAVGSTARFGAYQVTREEVMDFARKYDPQPFHLDDEAAAKTHFGRLSASGWHTCAMVMSMVVENVSKNQQAGLGSPGIDELRWLKPVYPGDTLRCETEVLEKRVSASRPEMGLFKSRMTVRNQHDVAVMTMVSNGMIATRP
ncbi:MaoC family dehydratase [Sphingomonas sp. SUN019]|uniref:MaoC family dehydratase n=1 Tax=Sphingomonas sp. SUN019 TaxID=2937788 RepID=UPI0038D3E40B